MLQAIIHWIVETVSSLGYTGIVVLMFLESSFIPFPSEIVIIPAGYLAFQGEMDFLTVVFFGISGSILGGLFNYYLAIKLGRPLLKKYQKWFFLNDEKFTRIEAYFRTHGPISTFIGRLIPLIRQYISFPAGLAKMNLKKFILYTALGAGIWVFILAFIGYQVGGHENLVKEAVQTSLFWIIAGCGGIVALYVIIHRRKMKKLESGIRN